MGEVRQMVLQGSDDDDGETKNWHVPKQRAPPAHCHVIKPHGAADDVRPTVRKSAASSTSCDSCRFAAALAAAS